MCVSLFFDLLMLYIFQLTLYSNTLTRGYTNTYLFQRYQLCSPMLHFAMLYRVTLHLVSPQGSFPVPLRVFLVFDNLLYTIDDVILDKIPLCVLSFMCS